MSRSDCQSIKQKVNDSLIKTTDESRQSLPLHPQRPRRDTIACLGTCAECRTERTTLFSHLQRVPRVISHSSPVEIGEISCFNSDDSKGSELCRFMVETTPTCPKSTVPRTIHFKHTNQPHWSDWLIRLDTHSVHRVKRGVVISILVGL